jgi:formiminotetrahydrofolate cyclodeaminase
MAIPSSFLDRTAADLLDLFAAGKNTPGAGSAAALTGAMAGSLLQAVARYTIRAVRKPGADASFLERAEALLEESRERSRLLSVAVDEDATAFEGFWHLKTGEALGPVIEIPLGIAEHCAALGEIGVELYDHGFKAAQGEADTAVRLALASGEAAVRITRLNLKLAEAGLHEEKLRSLDRRLGNLRKLIEERTSE